MIRICPKCGEVADVVITQTDTQNIATLNCDFCHHEERMEFTRPKPNVKLNTLGYCVIIFAVVLIVYGILYEIMNYADIHHLGGAN